MGPGGAERPAQPDLGAPLQYRDHHDVGDTKPSSQDGDAAEAQKQRGTGALDGEPGGESVRGTAYLHLLRVVGPRRGGQEGGYLAGMVRDGAHVDAAGVTVVAEHFPGEREADQDGPVDLGGQRQGIEDPDNTQPVTGVTAGIADPDPGGPPEPGEAERAGRLVPEHRYRVSARGGIQERPLPHAAAKRSEPRGAACPPGQP